MQNYNKILIHIKHKTKWFANSFAFITISKINNGLFISSFDAKGMRSPTKVRGMGSDTCDVLAE